ncbi:MAG: CoA transferase [Gammaproteobacteria bacterium]|nr:CoA transferase [Gammaproteobacteria bacterium]
MSTEPILDGLRVLDFTQHLAGPTTTRLMAEMGAEIIKLELAPWGDQVRKAGYLKGGRSAYFVQQNRGKKSLCVDVKTPAGRKLLLDLVPKFDVLVENFAPGVIGRMGLDWATVHRVNPKLIMCSISTFGQTGPLADRPGFDYIAQAYSGITSLIGERDQAPSLPMAAIGDVTTGVHALAAINAALYRRALGGPGQLLDISLIDSYFHCHELNVGMISASEGKLKPTRGGSHHPGMAPLGCFKGKAPDRYLIIIAVLHQWKEFCEAMGKPELLTDPRFKDPRERAKNRFALVAIIEDWIQSRASDEEVIRILEERRIPVAPVLSVAEAMQHPHFIERGTVRTVTEREFGTFQMPGMPLRFSEYANVADLEAPYLGEHNHEVLKNLLAYSAGEIAALESQHILVAESVPEAG